MVAVHGSTGPSPAPHAHRVGAGLGLAGLAVTVVGTFLPWLQSGQVRRNSYQTSGAMQRLLGLHGAADSALTAWPFVGLACAVSVALFALGLHRAGAVTALATGAAAAVVAVGALTVDGTGLVAPVRVGPAVTLAGAIAVLAAATLILVSRRRARLGRALHHDAAA